MSDEADPGQDSDTAEQADAAPDDAEVEEIQAEREQRLDADHRPEGAEVDNTDRDFDARKGLFTDAEDYDDAEVRFPPVEEQG